jgi:hypothetical protein
MAFRGQGLPDHFRGNDEKWPVLLESRAGQIHFKIHANRLPNLNLSFSWVNLLLQIGDILPNSSLISRPAKIPDMIWILNFPLPRFY